MRLSDLGDKEIVNLSNGSRHGQLANAELLFEERNGKIKAILVPDYHGKMSFLGGKDFIQLPWSAIRKIGEDIIIFEVQDL
ncbi:YlmC/YmxH family sporulation protein [Sinanaerobacter chloroacetimidivorans]|uniref:YlmC/YmxH family sporulation protein n=1 Tax=Sinanaerobacter chloroacetimidivorans TaxID=2818044 RepID=A0A8J7VZR5_9FIRM|nr:YlmC/YmxH family sporulation protein [Sinanaerobacter chloroacetimidivorans]MBR0596360.1 YlmC/YmxH family sporulation protein [Sinanaerobacter chloroacetimidivorans]